jgi:hypothetical protein
LDRVTAVANNRPAVTADVPIDYLEMGWSLDGALQEALKDLRDLGDPHVEHIALIGLDRAGRHAGFGHRADEHYLYMADGMSGPARAESRYFPPR